MVNLDLLPSNIDLSAAEVQLVNEVGREHALARALAPVLPEYDIVLIDCQPSLGLLTLNGLAASNDVIIPMQAEYFALRGVALLTDTIDKVVVAGQPQRDDPRRPRHHVRPAHAAQPRGAAHGAAGASATRSSRPSSPRP